MPIFPHLLINLLIDLNRDFRIEITSAVVLNSFNLIISQLQFYKKSMLCFATTAMLNFAIAFLSGSWGPNLLLLKRLMKSNKDN
jgi:hypothetical protein